MANSFKSSLAIALALFTLFHGSLLAVDATFNYKEALTKSIIFLEAQRSGKLPPNHRPKWRGDSGLDDGKLANVDLVGGYYDAGDNVKYQFPMAFTVTTAAWGALAYHKELHATGELRNVRAAIKWGTDYFLKATSKKNRLYAQVGDPVEDHKCWVRPEIMQTTRTVLKIDDNTPGTEVVAETSAAMAASSIVFRHTNKTYSRRLLNKAKLLFKFAVSSRKGTFGGACPFYCTYSGSTGYNDELMWAATWLYMATRSPKYMKYIQEDAVSAPVTEFSWDLKYAGAQILLAKLHFEGVKDLDSFKKEADSFVCSALPDSPYHQLKLTPGGLIYIRDGAPNTQYVTGIAFLLSVYGDILAKHNRKIDCGNKEFESTSLITFAKEQMDYLLGNNPEKRSYMVGFGKNPPLQAHHRGASVPASVNSATVSCGTSFANWFSPDTPNPNELTGAIVGGPDRYDKFVDKRSDSEKTEPCTYINSVTIGVLAKLAAHHA